VFEPLLDVAVFADVHLDFGTVAWANGADVAPEALYDRLVPAEGSAAKRSYEELFDDAERQMATNAAAMPELCRFFGIVIRMYWNEHEVPHFHAQYGEFVAAVEVESGMVTTRRFPDRALAFVHEWRREHRVELLANWERMRPR
jgi:hypothetical protein